MFNFQQKEASKIFKKRRPKGKVNECLGKKFVRGKARHVRLQGDSPLPVIGVKKA